MHGSEALTLGWWIFAAMLGVMLAALLVKRTPIGIALMFGALAGGLVSGNGIPVRHLVEGSFTYFDPMLIIFTAMFFMRVIEENGALGALARWIIATFEGKPSAMLAVVTLFIMFPAMLTGISTTSILTTGAVIAAPLISLGVPCATTGALIAMSAIMGMIAPPVNLIAMLIGQGVDMPYVGLEGPLSALAFPLAFASSFALGYRHLRRGNASRSADRPVR